MHVLSAAQQNATRIIQDEHENLSAVVHGMRYFIRAIDQGKKAPDPRVFHAMLFYLDGYPERVHHPKEDRYLFARLRHRTSELDITLAELEFQHAQGAGLVRGIQHALARFELAGASAFPPLRKLVEEYALFQIAHMRLEEDIVLTGAARFLTQEDWIAIDAGFSGIHDPLTGALIKNDFAKLFSLIIDIAPGTGSMEKTSD
ncbi:MAG: hypothetical protein A3I66_24250 [Burkholderiales bacterium RIFCSPLOWO2_02_FULL_57_36]|nr:MAG: hypothetical protein A3I66_24250 [Burkholderiales bacterium RIFCSPLOWO2_02_FULL_57_36]